MEKLYKKKYKRKKKTTQEEDNNPLQEVTASKTDIRNILFLQTNNKYKVVKRKPVVGYYSRSNFPEVFRQKGVLTNFGKFTGKQLCQNPFFDKLAGL